MKRIAGFLTFLLLLPVSGYGATDMKSLSLKATTDYFIPAYEELARKARLQSDAWQKSCSPEGLKKVYQDTADAWAKVQHVNFGPVVMFLRRDRLYHWPERRNAVSKGVNKLLSNQDVSILDPEKFANRSVAAQGLPALERLLYDDLVKDDWSCKIGQAIAANIAEITEGAAAEWKDLESVIAKGESHPIHFENMEELSNRILTELLTGFQMISDQKLLLPMGKTIKKAKPKRAEAWRSERSSRYIQESAEGLIWMIKTWGSFLPEADMKALNAQLVSYEKAITQIPSDLPKAVVNPEGRKELMAFKTVHKATRDLIVEKFTKSLGLTIGFNSLDGD